MRRDSLTSKVSQSWERILSGHWRVRWNPKHWFGWPRVIEKHKRPIEWSWLKLDSLQWYSHRGSLPVRVTPNHF